MQRQSKAYLYGGAAVLLWSTVATAFKLSLRYLEPGQLLLIASAVSTLTLFGLALGLGKLRELGRSTRRDWLHAAGLGLLNPFLYYLVLFEAYDRLPAQQAQPLNYTWAITLALLSVPLLKQRLGWRDLSGLVVSYAGVVVIASAGALGGRQATDGTGVALALGSTVIWSVYWIYHTKAAGDPVLRLLRCFLLGTVFTLCSVLLSSGLPPASAWRGLLGGAYVGVFEMGITFVLWLAALQHAEHTARVAALIFVAPFLSLVLIAKLVGETIAPTSLVGLVLIVGGIMLQQLGRKAPVRTATATRAETDRSGG